MIIKSRMSKELLKIDIYSDVNTRILLVVQLDPSKEGTC